MHRHGEERVAASVRRQGAKVGLARPPVDDVAPLRLGLARAQQFMTWKGWMSSSRRNGTWWIPVVEAKAPWGALCVGRASIWERRKPQITTVGEPNRRSRRIRQSGSRWSVTRWSVDSRLAALYVGSRGDGSSHPGARPMAKVHQVLADDEVPSDVPHGDRSFVWTTQAEPRCYDQPEPDETVRLAL